MMKYGKAIYCYHMALNLHQLLRQSQILKEKWQRRPLKTPNESTYMYQTTMLPGVKVWDNWRQYAKQMIWIPLCSNDDSEE